VNAASWLTGWSYRKSHVINPASGAGTNYQVKVIAHYGTGTDSGADVYLNSHCRTDFGDVRFTKSDGTTLLDYWMESKVDGDYAVFWVEVADDLSTNAVTIYIYYGKSDATTTSNGNNVFIAFCDHEEGNLTDWDSATSSASASTYYPHQGSYGLKEVGSSTYPVVTKNQVLVNQAYSTWMYDTGSTASNFLAMLRVLGANGPVGVGIWAGKSTTYYCYHDTSYTYYTTSISRTVGWHLLSALPSGSNVLLYIDGTLVATLTKPTETTKMEICGYTGGIGYFDDAYVRKYVDPEPAHGSWGSEETRVWRDVASWTFQVLTRTWRDIASWSFNLLTETWHDAACWSFNLATMIWNTVTYWTVGLGEHVGLSVGIIAGLLLGLLFAIILILAFS
jgi:hypothetical protein